MLLAVLLSDEAVLWKSCERMAVATIAKLELAAGFGDWNGAIHGSGIKLADFGWAVDAI